MLVHVVTLHTAFSHSFTVFCIPSAVCEQVLGNMADHDESLSSTSHYHCPLSRDYWMELLYHGQYEEPFVSRAVSNLLQQGAEVNKTDWSGSGQTCLHYANTYKYESVPEVLFRHGADVDAQDRLGMTPFYLACSDDRFPEEALHFLISRKANPLIESRKGDIPLTALTPAKRHLTDLVFDYTFGGCTDIIVKLLWLTEVMHRNSPGFSKLCNNSFSMEWKSQDLRDLCDTICGANANPENLTCFLNAYEDVAVAMFDQIKSANPIGSILWQMSLSGWSFERYRVKNEKCLDLIRIIFNSRVALRFVQRLEIDRVAVGDVIKVGCPYIGLKELTDLVARMLQLGVHVTHVDFYDVWAVLINSEFYHMITEAKSEDVSRMVQAGLLSPEVILKHDVHVTSVKLLSYIKHEYNREIVEEVSRRDVVQFLDYFCDQGLKEAVLRVYEGKDLAKVQERINQLPNVTSLIQLSRDVSRNIIIETFDIKTKVHSF